MQTVAEISIECSHLEEALQDTLEVLVDREAHVEVKVQVVIPQELREAHDGDHEAPHGDRALAGHSVLGGDA